MAGQKIQRCLQNIQINLPFDFPTHLGLEITDFITKGDRYLIRILLLSAKRTLTEKWLQADIYGLGLTIWVLVLNQQGVLNMVKISVCPSVLFFVFFFQEKKETNLTISRGSHVLFIYLFI